MAARLPVVTYAPWRRLQRRREIRKCRAQQVGGQEEEQDEREDSAVKVEVSSSAMRVLQGMGGSGSGLIEANQRKRKQQSSEALAEMARDELFAKSDMYVPRHDNLFPLLVATMAIVYDDSDDEGESDRFAGSGASRLKAAVEEDVSRFASKSLLASDLFCDLNGEPLNSEPRIDTRFERWFLLSMYVKFKLWWRGPSPAADTALDYAYRMSNFVVDADGDLARILETVSGSPPSRRFAMRYGRLSILPRPSDPSTLQRELQRELDKRKPGWSAFVLGASDDRIACLITHCSSLIFIHLPERKAAAISSFMLAWAAASTVGISVSPSPSLWDFVAPLCLVATVTGGSLLRRAVATLYGIPWAVSPLFVLPVPQVGAIPTFFYYRGCLPNRRCLFDMSVASPLLQLALSALLVAIGYSTSWMPGVLAPSNTFSHSASLSWLLNQVSAVSSWEDGGSAAVSLNPLVLGGLLGVNFSLLSLLPCGVSDGGRMLTACLGRRVSGYVSGLTFVLGSVALLSSSNFVFALLWACSCAVMPEDSFQRDEVSDPGFVRKMAAVILTSAACGSLVPHF